VSINSINPTNGQLLNSFEPLSDTEIHEKLRRAAFAFPRFRKLSFADRAKMMNKASELLEADQEEIARLATIEMGKRFDRRGRKSPNARGLAATMPNMANDFSNLSPLPRMQDAAMLATNRWASFWR